jgi:hypothetical protein
VEHAEAELEQRKSAILYCGFIFMKEIDTLKRILLREAFSQNRRSH